MKGKFTSLLFVGPRLPKQGDYHPYDPSKRFWIKQNNGNLYWVGLEHFNSLLEKQKSWTRKSYERCVMERKAGNRKKSPGEQLRKSEWKKRNPESVRVEKRKYHAKYPAKRKLLHDKWKAKNRSKHLEWRKNFYKTNQNHRISELLRARIRVALKGIAKSKRTRDILGCSIEHFKSFLESKFLPGMSWENNTVTGWHIDHIRPCSSFDFSKQCDIEACFHYTNMQPMWASDNLKKSNKWIS